MSSFLLEVSDHGEGKDEWKENCRLDPESLEYVAIEVDHTIESRGTLSIMWQHAWTVLKTEVSTSASSPFAIFLPRETSV